MEKKNTNILKQHLSVVFIGHVDHGKSTIIGRLLADTNSLPEGKLEQIKDFCKKNARPFEYAFLLDALKDEQEQGITIDSARAFFKTSNREYMIIDAPGHIEFLKNMVTGAAYSDAAMIVIDAKEGIQENSRRHGYIVSMIGINQVSVLINKMDLVDYDKEVYFDIRNKYEEFLKSIKVSPISFIPISGRAGDNILNISSKMKWYNGPTLLEQIELFKTFENKEALPFRFPVQDIYRFTEHNDNRRIFAGTVITGNIKIGDEVIFYPTKKESKIKTIEMFNSEPLNEATFGQAVGFTLETEIYIRPGELMSKKDDTQPVFSTRFKTNIFWLGKNPMIKGKPYKIKIGTSKEKVKLIEIINIFDSSELSTIKNKQQIDRFDVAEVILETSKPVAFDVSKELKFTSRFVIIDNFQISGCGVILEQLSDEQTSLMEHIKEREVLWKQGFISQNERAVTYKHKSKFIVFTGQNVTKVENLSKLLEKRLFFKNFKAYYLGFANIGHTLNLDLKYGYDRDEHLRRLGELARILTDAGLIFITTIFDIDDYEVQKLRLLTQPNDFLIIQIGECELCGSNVDIIIDENEDTDITLDKIQRFLRKYVDLLEYYI